MAEGLEKYGYAEQPDYLDYLPSKFERAGTPTGLQQFGDSAGGEAVRAPISFGAFHPVDRIPNIDQLKTVNPELIHAEKHLYEGKTARVYMQKIQNLNGLSLRAAQMGFDINRPDIRKPEQFELHMLYKNHLADAHNFAAESQAAKKEYDELAKVASENKGRFVPQFYEKGLAPGQEKLPTSQQFRQHFEHYGKSPETESFNANIPVIAPSQSTVPKMAAEQRNGLIAGYKAEAEIAMKNGDVGRHNYLMSQIDQLDKTGIDYSDANKLALEKEKFRTGQANETAGADLIHNTFMQMKRGTLYGARPNSEGQTIYQTNNLPFDSTKQPKYEEYLDEYGQKKFRTIEDPANVMTNVTREPDGTLYVTLASGQKQPLSESKAIDIISRMHGLGQKGTENAIKYAASKQAITGSGFDNSALLGKEAHDYISPLEQVYSESVKNLAKANKEYNVPEETKTIINEAVIKGIPFDKLPIGYGGQTDRPIGYGGASDAKGLYDAMIKEKAAHDDLLDAEKNINTGNKFNAKTLTSNSTSEIKSANKAQPNSEKTVERKTKDGKIAIFDSATKKFIKYK